VTKEKFLRAVVGDPPLYISASENAALESRLLSTKASLKAQKIEVAELVADLENRGRELSRRYQQVQLQTAQLESLPEQIDGLKSTIAKLQAAQEPKTDNPLLGLPLTKTLEVLAERDAESAKLDREIAELQAAAERRTRELDRMQSELEPLRAHKTRAMNDAQDAQTRKAQGISGLGDDLEQRGRWLRGVETTMRSILEAGA
jgi:chromosome segregation ATPase